MIYYGEITEICMISLHERDGFILKILFLSELFSYLENKTYNYIDVVYIKKE